MGVYYDEDITLNPFFLHLRDFLSNEILQEKGTVIFFVPNNSRVKLLNFTEECACDYIAKEQIDVSAVSKREAGTSSACSHYETLSGDRVTIKDSCVIIEGDRGSCSSGILFEETYYDDSDKAIKLLCLQDILFPEIEVPGVVYVGRSDSETKGNVNGNCKYSNLKASSRSSSGSEGNSENTTLVDTIEGGVIVQGGEEYINDDKVYKSWKQYCERRNSGKCSDASESPSRGNCFADMENEEMRRNNNLQGTRGWGKATGNIVASLDESVRFLQKIPCASKYINRAQADMWKLSRAIWAHSNTNSLKRDWAWKREEKKLLSSLLNSLVRIYRRTVANVLEGTAKANKRVGKDVVATYFVENLHISVECALLSDMYWELFPYICSEFKDQENLLYSRIRHISDLTLDDIPYLHLTTPALTKAVNILSALDGLLTAMEKRSCLRKAVFIIGQDASQQQAGPAMGAEFKGSDLHTALNADMLLPTLIFVLIKSRVKNWHSQLYFADAFLLSGSRRNEGDWGYILATYTAAVEQIKTKEFQSHSEVIKILNATCAEASSSSVPKRSASPPKSYIDHVNCIFFEEVLGGNISKVRRMLNVDSDIYTYSSGVTSANNNNAGQVKVFQKGCAALKRVPSVISAYKGVWEKSNERTWVSSRSNSVACDLNSEFDECFMCHPLCNCAKCGAISDKRHSFGGFKSFNAKFSLHSSVYARNEKGNTALHMVSEAGLCNMAQMLLDHGAVVNASNYKGEVPLHSACKRDYPSMVELLIQNGSNVNVSDYEGNTPLHICASHGHTACAGMLLHGSPHNIDVDKANFRGDTALHLAVQWNCYGMVELLLSNGVQTSIRNKRGFIAEEFGQTASMTNLFRILGRYGRRSTGGESPELNSKKRTSQMIDRYGNAALCLSDEDIAHFEQIELVIRCVEANDMQNVKALLGNFEFQAPSSSPGAKCDAICLTSHDTPLSNCKTSSKLLVMHNRTYVTPLHVASLHGHFEIVKYLLNMGVMLSAINMQNMQGQTALHLACQYNHEEIVREMVSFNAHSYLQDDNGSTPLHYSCAGGNVQISRLLLSKGRSKVNIKNLYGDTPLHNACKWNNSVLVSMLIAFGASPLVVNNLGKTPIDYAKTDSISDTLISAGEALKLKLSLSGNSNKVEDLFASLSEKSLSAAISRVSMDDACSVPFRPALSCGNSCKGELTYSSDERFGDCFYSDSNNSSQSTTPSIRNDFNADAKGRSVNVYEKATKCYNNKTSHYKSPPGRSTSSGMPATPSSPRVHSNKHSTPHTRNVFDLLIGDASPLVLKRDNA
eukprot:Nk52_evm39s240 gene=Nk52_evmTU39s240